MTFTGTVEDIVIIGGGICGLATALALHRVGLRSVVLERGDSLRATGATIGIFTNGWRALDQLGVGPKLRQKAMLIRGYRDVLLDGKRIREVSFCKEEVRCVRRGDLIETMAEELPPETIHFGCQITAVDTDPVTSFPILHVDDGNVIKPKVVIGCDGVSSIIAKELGLKAPRISQMSGIRGVTTYPAGHTFSNEFFRILESPRILGRIPIDSQSVFWLTGRPWHPKDSQISRDPELIREAVLQEVKDFPAEIIEMVKKSDSDSLSYTRIRYRAPWDLLLPSFHKGTMTVAGDAMHVMGPFLGQGGSAGLEDAIVLARCLGEEINGLNGNSSDQELQISVGRAFGKYVKERKMRVFRLSAHTYLTGLVIQTSSMAKKLLILAIMMVFLGNALNHAQYDCGTL